MAEIVYIDETGADGSGGRQQPQLILVAVLVPEDQVSPLGAALARVASHHLGVISSADFEFHGHQIWQGEGPWASLGPEERLAAYLDAINVLVSLDLCIAHATIEKLALHEKYGGLHDKNSYRLGLQFLLEKIDSRGGSNRIVVADETKEQELSAIRMVSDLQRLGVGEVPGRKLRTIIDSLHFVQSHASAGVQLADLVAYVIQRRRRGVQNHPNAEKVLESMHEVIRERTLTWREPWPAKESGWR